MSCPIFLVISVEKSCPCFFRCSERMSRLLVPFADQHVEIPSLTAGNIALTVGLKQVRTWRTGCNNVICLLEWQRVEQVFFICLADGDRGYDRVVQGFGGRCHTQSSSRRRGDRNEAWRARQRGAFRRRSPRSRLLLHHRTAYHGQAGWSVTRGVRASQLHVAAKSAFTLL